MLSRETHGSQLVSPLVMTSQLNRLDWRSCFPVTVSLDALTVCAVWGQGPCILRQGLYKVEGGIGSCEDMPYATVGFGLL